MASRDDDFLSRWSRRKAEARGGGLRRKEDDAPRPAPRPAGREQAPAAPAPERAANAAASGSAAPELSFADALRREEETPVTVVNTTPAAREDEFASLTEEEHAEFADVDFDKLTPDSDFTRFMKEGVPEIIRRRALRALWSHPVLSAVDRLNDYDDDFSDAAMAIKIVSSNYKPGSGYLTEEERAASHAEAADPEAGEPADAAETREAHAEDDGEGEEEREFAEAEESPAEPEEDAEADEADEADEAAGADDGEVTDMNEKS